MGVGVKFETAGVHLTYPGSPVPALAGVSTSAEGGGFKAVAGPNGCGKTTLLRVMLGLLTPDKGEALLDGRRIEEWEPRRRAQAVGVVTQREAFPFPLTVRGLVGMGRYPHLGPLQAERPTDRKEVEAAMAECGLTGFADRDVATLSGGELQLARIARALAQRPKALALDEPSASLDLHHRMRIFRLLRRKADEGRTVIVVVHDLELAARFADEALLLKAGKVVADGPPAEVMRTDRLSDLYDWPVAVSRESESGMLRVTALEGDPACDDRQAEPVDGSD